MNPRIGILGGTFNPVHYGHLIIGENAREQYSLDKVYFLPTGDHAPHKDSRKILPARVRSQMVQLAIASNPGFSYSEYELLQRETVYTYRTLQAFQEKYQTSDLYFILGADSLAYLEKWKNPDQICRSCRLLAAVRDQLDQEKLEPIKQELERAYGAQIGFINSPNFEVSSHMIRERVGAGQSIRYLLPKAVEDYIYKNNLYYNV